MIVLAPWDSSMLKEIEKAIQASDLGITPMSDGKVIRLELKPPRSAVGSRKAG